ncbi:MAG: phosphoribosylformylglycinamidine synthase subunit PurQ, partial [Candidatus Omnitrophica bacterium]|nr:phosphoribosylformylglycinamidine synthase subunit PurQ [Candidatus Omnitrophota bacterium]
ASATYSDRWVDLDLNGKSAWTKNVGKISLPIAHGEGNFYADQEVLKQINSKKLVAARYIQGEICKYQNLPANPNGSLENIAGITDESGKIFGLMPHPERAIFFTQLPHWTFLREIIRMQGGEMPKEGEGLKIFRQGVEYFK